MANFSEFKKKICKPLKIDERTCNSLWKNVLDCFDFTEKTEKECSVVLTKRGISKEYGTESMVAKSLAPEDVEYPFDFHTHPKKIGAIAFSEGDKLTLTMWKPKIACVGGWEYLPDKDKFEKKMLCIQRLGENYPFKCEEELEAKIWAKQRKIEEKYKPLIEEIQKELDRVIDEITKIPLQERKSEEYKKLEEKRKELLEKKRKLLDEKHKEIAPLKFELDKVKEICCKRYPYLKIKFDP